MVEELGSIIKKGFETWKENLTICIPFVLSFFLTIIVLMLIIGGALLATFPSLEPYLSTLDGATPESVPQLLAPMFQHIVVIVIAVIIAVIIALLINAFFFAGAIGMANEATRKGRTSISEMIDYGKRKFLSMFFVNIIIALIALIGFVFVLPGVFAILPAITSSQTQPDVTTFASLALGILIMIVYIAVVSIIFALPPYAVVMDDIGAIEGLKRGFSQFMKNKLNVFVLWLLVFAIAVGASVILGSIPYIGQMISIVVSVIIIQPLSVIWWSRLYLSIKEPPEPLL
jgi:hypothetical protein